jgi:UDP-glucose 4-epimerase
MSSAKLFLVTGGFGFIGSHLVERLLKSGAKVHVVDNLSTSPIDLSTYLDLVDRPPNLTHDICDLVDYCATKPSVKYDGIYHLASVVGPVGVLEHAGKISRMIVGDMEAIAELALRDRAKIVDVSTSEVYGGGRDGYCSEQDIKFIQPKVTVRLEYAVGKLAAEISLVNKTKVSHLEACIVRPFNVAGPRQSPQGGFVLPRFINQALAGEPLTVYHDGSMVRAFTHVQDIVEGIVCTMERGENGYAYNIGNPENKTSIRDLAERVIRISKSNSKTSFVDPKVLFGPLFEEANDKFPDASLALTSLGWNPKHGIDVVISDALDYTRRGRKA